MKVDWVKVAKDNNLSYHDLGKEILSAAASYVASSFLKDQTNTHDVTIHLVGADIIFQFTPDEPVSNTIH